MGEYYSESRDVVCVTSKYRKLQKVSLFYSNVNDRYNFILFSFLSSVFPNVRL